MDRSHPISLAPRVGLEPTTSRLTAACSTIELSGSGPGWETRIVPELLFQKPLILTRQQLLASYPRPRHKFIIFSGIRQKPGAWQPLQKGAEEKYPPIGKNPLITNIPTITISIIFFNLMTSLLVVIY